MTHTSMDWAVQPPRNKHGRNVRSFAPEDEIDGGGLLAALHQRADDQLLLCTVVVPPRVRLAQSVAPHTGAHRATALGTLGRARVRRGRSPSPSSEPVRHMTHTRSPFFALSSSVACAAAAPTAVISLAAAVGEPALFPTPWVDRRCPLCLCATASSS